MSSYVSFLKYPYPGWFVHPWFVKLLRFLSIQYLSLFYSGWKVKHVSNKADAFVSFHDFVSSLVDHSFTTFELEAVRNANR